MLSIIPKQRKVFTTAQLYDEGIIQIHHSECFGVISFRLNIVEINICAI